MVGMRVGSQVDSDIDTVREASASLPCCRALDPTVILQARVEGGGRGSAAGCGVLQVQRFPVGSLMALSVPQANSRVSRIGNRSLIGDSL